MSFLLTSAEASWMEALQQQQVIKTSRSTGDAGEVEVSAPSPEDTKRENLPQPLCAHPAAIWQADTRLIVLAQQANTITYVRRQEANETRFWSALANLQAAILYFITLTSLWCLKHCVYTHIVLFIFKFAWGNIRSEIIKITIKHIISGNPSYHKEAASSTHWHVIICAIY